jgi:putative membrane protein
MQRMYNSGWQDGHWGPGGWIAMVLMMDLLWGVTAGLIVYVVRSLGHRPHADTGAGAPTPDHATRILDERFARGEIDADEYQQRRDLLRRR